MTDTAATVVVRRADRALALQAAIVVVAALFACVLIASVVGRNAAGNPGGIMGMLLIGAVFVAACGVAVYRFVDLCRRPEAVELTIAPAGIAFGTAPPIPWREVTKVDMERDSEGWLELRLTLAGDAPDLGGSLARHGFSWRGATVVVVAAGALEIEANTLYATVDAFWTAHHKDEHG